MPARPLYVLILEDRPDDAELMLYELRRAGFEPRGPRVDDEAGYLAALDAALDIILVDYARVATGTMARVPHRITQDF